MKRAVFLCVAAFGAMLALRPAAGEVVPDSAPVTIPFGILRSDTSCPAATHVVLNPCPPNQPTLYAVFPRGRKLDRFEGQNVTLRGTVDQTACSLPLIQARRISLTHVVPPCPPQ